MNPVPDAPAHGTQIGRTVSQLSVPLVGLAAVSFASGVVSGFLVYLDRSPVRAEQSEGTAAWRPHIVLFVLSMSFFGIKMWRRRVNLADGDRPFLFAPLGKPAARRIRRTVKTAARSPRGLARLAATSIPVMVLLYGCWRMGEQVLAGLDPNFTVNAWGGPTYLGAMACHYLDGVLLMAASAWLLSRLLLPDPWPVTPPRPKRRGLLWRVHRLRGRAQPRRRRQAGTSG